MKRKIISFLTVLILVFSLNITAFAYSRQAFVATDYLNVYDKGGWNCNIIDCLPRWTSIIVEADAGYGWYKISYNGKTGYVAGYYIIFGITDRTPATTTAIVEENVETSRPAAVGNSKITANEVHFRSGPSLNSSIYMVLQKGDSITVRGACGEWYEVQYGELIGYVYGTYVNNNDISDQAAVPVVEQVVQPTNTINGQTIVNTAMQYLGVPYRWGGESSSGFDCSGLVYAVYKENGIELNRIAQDMYYNGTNVSIKHMKPGDIAYFGSSVYNIEHVGIYVGDNMIIHSSYGDMVRIESLSELTGLRLVAARRVL